MVNKRFHFIYVGALLNSVLLSPVAMADNNPPTVPKAPIQLQPRPNPSHRPKAPSMQRVNAVYSDGFLTFEFAYPEGECELQLMDLSTGEMVVEYFDSAVTEPVYVGYHSTASLTVTTENGNTYTGEW